MAKSGLKFGTSGLRGLVTELNRDAVIAWTSAFLAMLATRDLIQPGGAVFVGQDLRKSSPDIAAYVMEAIARGGYGPVDCGAVPTPALALYAQGHGAAAIMVTGSHIPDDRNGLKFYTPDGEIDKAVEGEILAFHQSSRPLEFSKLQSPEIKITGQPAKDYVERYVDFFGSDALESKRVGVYQHSSVARDLLVDVLERLGAHVVALGRSERFIPVDTEAVDPQTLADAKSWVKEHRLDAIVSTDGDADRPLIFDEAGEFIRGDLVGAMTARNLGADIIVTPVTSNSSLESCICFREVRRTRVGSPHVIADMEGVENSGGGAVVGFEANGGTFLGSQVARKGMLSPLLTRDAVLPVLCCLEESIAKKQPMSALAADFNFRIALSDRLQNMEREKAMPFLDRLENEHAFTRDLFGEIGEVLEADGRDGVRVALKSGEVVHYRMSGNAPELRCYVEADEPVRAEELLKWGFAQARKQILCP